MIELNNHASKLDDIIKKIHLFVFIFAMIEILPKIS